MRSNTIALRGFVEIVRTEEDDCSIRFLHPAIEGFLSVLPRGDAVGACYGQIRLLPQEGAHLLLYRFSHAIGQLAVLLTEADMDSRAGRVGIVLDDICFDRLVPGMAADLGLGALGELLGEGVGPGEPDAVPLPSIENELQFTPGDLIETTFELTQGASRVFAFEECEYAGGRCRAIRSDHIGDGVRLSGLCSCQTGDLVKTAPHGRC